MVVSFIYLVVYFSVFQCGVAEPHLSCIKMFAIRSSLTKCHKTWKYGRLDASRTDGFGRWAFMWGTSVFVKKSNRPSWESVICVPVRKAAEIRDSRGAAGRQSVVRMELSGNIRKAGLRGSAQESDGRDSTNRIDMAFWHLSLADEKASNSKKSSRKSLSLRRFQVHFASRCRPPPADKRRKKMFFQPNGKSISWDWNAFRLK